MSWYLAVLKNYVGFSGRARRTEYWMFFLVNIIISIILGIIDAIIHSQILSLIYGLAVLLPSLAVGCRRLHDTDRTGWWLLIGLIPVIGAIVLIVFFCIAGDTGDNKYGPDPKGGAYGPGQGAYGADPAYPPINYGQAQGGYPQGQDQGQPPQGQYPQGQDQGQYPQGQG